MIKETIVEIALAVLLVFAGYNLHDYMHTCPVPEPVIKTEYTDSVKTEIAYVPKEEKETADIEVKAEAPDITVKVNGKDFAINKAENERFVFEQNKLQVTQSSSADLNINIPTVDKTKRWQIGAGVSKDGVVGLVGFPIRENMGGFIAGRSDDVLAGVTIQF